MNLMERQAIDRAFRSGLLTDPDGEQSGLAERADLGAGELAVMNTLRLPGLASAETAFETGRTLRVIARLFDQAGAPARVIEQFRDNLSAAVMAEAMRARPSWSGADTLDMFLDMYGRIIGGSERDLGAIRSYIEHRVAAPSNKRRLRDRLSVWLGSPAAA